ncbi:hypothetical protein P4G95_08560 [Burkholderia vietnamiensis]|uniref:hypothetical protein n=1 Tax=Burkholderia vietnamiensis TaxID=60552 RepID=UPI0024BFBBC9|nr:hypothetical protein [Burkholderia vietnamiensis]WHU90930.1 hypothetical protein P4G95_08560 [Burkholderia vietnamiensis]
MSAKFYFYFFLASQTAGGSRGLMARKAQPKFPKNRRRTRRFFFSPFANRPSQRIPPHRPAPTESPESMNLPHAL